MGRVSEMGVARGFMPAGGRTMKRTSLAAGEKRHRSASSQGARIRLALMSMPEGGTCYEIATHTGLTHVQVARMMKTLSDQGYVADGLRTRPSPSGDECIVWVGR